MLFLCLLDVKLFLIILNKAIVPLSSACTFTSFGVHENVKLQPTTIGGESILAREPNPQFWVNLHSDAVKGCYTSV